MDSFSVLLNVYPKDNFKLLSDALRSIFNQSAPPSELIVVSDGSMPQAQRELINSYASNGTFPVRVLETQHSNGLWSARNLGLHAATTKYVALMDADDVMHPNRLEIQSNFLSKNKVQVVGSAIVEIDSKTGLVVGSRSVATDHSSIHEKLPFRNVINHPTVMLDREFAIKVGGYRNFYLAEDYELWARIAKSGGILANIELALLGFHIDERLFKRRGGLKFIKSEITLAQTLRSHFTDLNRLKFYLNLCFRMAYRLMPWRIRKFLHLRVLGSNFVIVKKMNEAEFLASAPISI